MPCSEPKEVFICAIVVKIIVFSSKYCGTDLKPGPFHRSNRSMYKQTKANKPSQLSNFQPNWQVQRLDSPFVVFNGEPYEAEPIHLTGTLILNNTDHMNVRSIKIRLEGKWRVSWFVEPSTSTSQIKDKGIVINEEMVLYPAEGQGISSVAHKIAPGNHEWRFSFYMNSHLPESVEGLPGSYIVYGLTAEIDRGYMSKNLVASKHVRVIRTLGRDLTDTVPMPYVCPNCSISILHWQKACPSNWVAE